MELKFVEVEVAKLNLKPDDTLIIKLKGDSFFPETMQSLQDHFKEAFKNNPVKVLLFSLPDGHDMNFEVVSEKKSCNTGSYCADCSCGKKSLAKQILTQEEAIEHIESQYPPEDEL